MVRLISRGLVSGSCCYLFAFFLVSDEVWISAGRQQFHEHAFFEINPTVYSSLVNSDSAILLIWTACCAAPRWAGMAAACWVELLTYST
jgi:hypothetical protein